MMDGVRSPLLSTRSLVVLSRTSSLRGSAVHLLSLRLQAQAATQKATPQHASARQNIVSKPGGYPLTCTCMGMRYLSRYRGMQ